MFHKMPFSDCLLKSSIFGGLKIQNSALKGDVKNCPAKTPPASQVGLTDNILSSELRIYKEARQGDAEFKGTSDLENYCNKGRKFTLENCNFLYSFHTVLRVGFPKFSLSLITTDLFLSVLLSLVSVYQLVDGTTGEEDKLGNFFILF